MYTPWDLVGLDARSARSFWSIRKRMNKICECSLMFAKAIIIIYFRNFRSIKLIRRSPDLFCKSPDKSCKSHVSQNKIITRPTLVFLMIDLSKLNFSCFYHLFKATFQPNSCNHWWNEISNWIFKYFFHYLFKATFQPTLHNHWWNEQLLNIQIFLSLWLKLKLHAKDICCRSYYPQDTV